MARTFAINTSDAVQSLLTSSSTQRTRGLMFRLNEANGAIANYGRIYSKGSGTVDEQVRYLDDQAKMEFRFNWSGATGIWQWTAPALNGWHRLEITYDYGSTANDPVVYIDGSSVSITETGTPSGSVSLTAGPFLIGNNVISASNSGAGAEIAEFSIWDRILSADEIVALGKGFTPEHFPLSLVEYIPLVRDSISRILGAPTVTGTTLFDHPRVFDRPANLSMPGLSQAYTRSVSETVTTSSDSIARQTGAGRGISETVSGSDSIARQTTAARSISETVTGSDSPARIYGAVRGPSETVTAASDAITRVYGAVRGPSETVTSASDSIARTYGAVRGPSETVTGTDSIARQTNLARSISESFINGSDTPTRIYGAVRGISETVTGSESIARSQVLARAVAETVTSASDTITRSFGAPRSIVESVVVTTTLAQSNFTAADNTLLSSYTPEVGPSWSAVSNYKIVNNKLQNVSASGINHAVLAGVGSDVVLQVDVSQIAGTAVAVSLIIRRLDSANYWEFFYDFGNGWQLDKVTSGQDRFIGPPLSGTTGTVKFQAMGDTITAISPDGSQISVQDPSFNTQTGIALILRGDNTVASIVDNVLVFKPTDTVARNTNAARGVAETVTAATATPTRVYGAPRAISETVTTATDAITRQTNVARNVPEWFNVSSTFSNTRGYYKLDAVPAVDSMGLSASANVAAGTPTVITGKLGNALRFDASSFTALQTGSGSSLSSLGSSFMLWFWLRRSVPSVGSDKIVGFGNSQSAGHVEYEIGWTSGNKITFAINNVTMTSATSCPSDNAWHLVTCWYDASASTASIKIDNLPADSFSSVGAPPSISSSLTIGADVNGSVFYTGDLDGIGMRRAVPTTIELDEIWNNGEGKDFSSTPTDSVSRIYGAVRNPSETVTAATDSIARSFGAKRAITETTSCSDTPTRQINVTRTPSETVTGTDSIARTVTTNRSISETVPGASDTVAGSYGAVRSVSETITGATDTPTRIYGAVRNPSETVTAATDSPTRALTLARTISETVTVTDTPSRMFAAGRAISETITAATDSVDSGRLFTRNVSETLSATDITVSRSAGFPRAISETVTGAETIARAASAARTVTETVSSSSDSIARIYGAVRATSETAGNADITVARTYGAPRAISETVTGTDSVARLVNASRNIAETVTGTDSIARAVTIARGITETVTGSDSISRTIAAARGISETVTMSDSVTRQFAAARSDSESAPASDTVARVFGGSRTAAETITATNIAVTFNQVLTRGLSEAVASSSDSVVRQAGFGRNIPETVAGVATVTQGGTFARTVTETIAGAFDDVTRALALARAIVETVAATADTLSRMYNALREPSENAGNADITIARAGASIRSMVETVAPATDDIARTVVAARAIVETVGPSSITVTVTGVFFSSLVSIPVGALEFNPREAAVAFNASEGAVYGPDQLGAVIASND